MTKRIIITAGIIIIIFIIFLSIRKSSIFSDYEIGEAVDSLNNVIVYYNDDISNVSGRNLVDGYNLGLKYQCVEFVKRYYYEHFDHKMPDSYGHAKSFFDSNVEDGKINKQRDLKQFTNPSFSKPLISDLIVMDGSLSNKFGHVAIISKATDNKIEIIQQNPGPHSSSRKKFKLKQTNDGKWQIESSRVLGWLRK